MELARKILPVSALFKSYPDMLLHQTLQEVLVIEEEGREMAVEAVDRQTHVEIPMVMAGENEDVDPDRIQEAGLHIQQVARATIRTGGSKWTKRLIVIMAVQQEQPVATSGLHTTH